MRVKPCYHTQPSLSTGQTLDPESENPTVSLITSLIPYFSSDLRFLYLNTDRLNAKCESFF